MSAALGLGCFHGVVADNFSIDGAPTAITVMEGGQAPFTPREGVHAVILSTGDATTFLKSRDQLNQAGLCIPNDPLCPSTDHLRTADVLPAPIDPTPVGNDTCHENPELLGRDCSNTIHEQWSSGNELAFDYAEIRFSAEVPGGVDRLSFDYTFFTAEYPVRFQSGNNDLFLVWVDSERWTGNVALDQDDPLSANTTRFEMYDAAVPGVCPEPCESQELHGTSMEGHAATNWRTTAISANPDDVLTLVFAIFDVGDGDVDSVALLDNVRWGCAIPE